ncbi:uncharacterized protein [Procambarus clarkii]|uniref:uncharacterized protein n=1 Tax=Procambarus clarkii TaxID=6728 RepID=UPI003743ECB6
MTTERRWWERPAPRDWHPTPAELQKIKSASSIRKSLLNRSSSRNFERASLRSSGSVKSDVHSVDKSYLNRSIRGSISSRTSSSKSPLTPPVRQGVNHNGNVRAQRSRGGHSSSQSSSAAGSSVEDLGATYVFTDFNRGSQADIDRILRTSPSTPAQNSSIARYHPLPAISATPSTRTDNNIIPDATPSTRTDNNIIPDFEPPPLVRSRTFDVIDTKMMNLAVVDGVGDDGGDSRADTQTPTRTVTVSIEGKPLAEFLLHARDGLLRSRPGTRYGRSEPAESSNSVLQPDVNYDFGKLMRCPSREHQLGNDSGISEEEDNSEDETDPYKHDPVERFPRKETNDSCDLTEPIESFTEESCAREVNDIESFEQDKSTNSDNTSELPGSSALEKDDGESSIERLEPDDNMEANGSPEWSVPGGAGEAATGEAGEAATGGVDEAATGGAGEAATGGAGEAATGGGSSQEVEQGEDIIVYFKLPDDSLVLVSSPRSQTLAELLQVVENTRMGERRLVVAQDGLEQTDLTKTLVELGITDNTTLYLLNG